MFMALVETPIPDPEDDDAPWIPDDTFGGRLAQIRQRLHMNVKQAAEKCDIGVQTWRNWEADKSPRNFEDVAQQIADALRVDYVWLLTGLERPGIRSRCLSHLTSVPGVFDEQLSLDDELAAIEARAGWLVYE